MAKGGYTVLNLKGNTFNIGTTVTVPGAYATLEASNKAILVEDYNLVNYGEFPFFTSKVSSDNSFVMFRNTRISGQSILLRVRDDDAVVFQVYTPAAPAVG